MPATAATDPSFITTAADFIQNGGSFMYIILVVLGIGLGLTAERWLTLQRAKTSNKKFWDQVFPALQKGQFKQAMELSKESKTEAGQILSYGLSRTSTARRAEEIEMAMEEGLMDVVPRLEQRTPYIATLANVATLLGLLGTIIGLIQAFTAVANADPAEKADLLSASISVAMNTTALGLIAAIPLLLSFAYLQSKTGTVVDSLEQISIRFANIYRQARSAAENKSAA